MLSQAALVLSGPSLQTYLMVSSGWLLQVGQILAEERLLREDDSYGCVMQRTHTGWCRACSEGWRVQALTALLELLYLRYLVLVFLVFGRLEHPLPLRPGRSFFAPPAWSTLPTWFSADCSSRSGSARSLRRHRGGHAAVPDAWRTAIAARPIWLQVITVVIIADLGFYLAHRLFHAVPWLWHFHAVHHSIEEMDWLAAHRVHPVDQIVTKGASLVPVFVLGFSGPPSSSPR